MKNGKRYPNKNNSTCLKLGIIGCGSVSEMYLDYLSNLKGVQLYACADIEVNLAKDVAKKYNIKQVLDTEALINSSEIDIVLNLTNPSSHYKINMAVLKNKKALFCEKPYALNGRNADELLELAKKNKCSFFSAPDTYLAKPFQAAKKILRKGCIGKVLSSSIISFCCQVETWHPRPAFFYKKGAGPLFDRGIYYLTILIFLFGRVASVCCYSSKFFKKRHVKLEGNNQFEINVEVPTHYVCILKFRSDETASLILSFDGYVCPTIVDNIYIYGLNGVVEISKPLEYSGIARIYNSKTSKWLNINKYGSGYSINSDVRGVGIERMIKEIRSKKVDYNNAEMANHAIKVMGAIDESGRSGRAVFLK